MRNTISGVGAIYHGTNANELEECINSLLNQTCPLNEIIIVIDGFISKDTELIVSKYQKYLLVIRNSVNSGLGHALNIGISKANGNWIMRFDTDDVNILTRVEILRKTISNYPNVDVFGSYIQEFGFSDTTKKVPLSDKNIKRYLKFHVPLNHPSVIFKKEYWLDVGGYPENIFPEDYVFWLKGKKIGKIFKNIPFVTVNMRISKGLIDRRRGMNYFIAEIKYLQYCWENELLSASDIFIQSLIKLPLRLFPTIIFRTVIKLKRQYDSVRAK